MYKFYVKVIINNLCPEYMTNSYYKSPYTDRKYSESNSTTQKRHKNFDYTTIIVHVMHLVIIRWWGLLMILVYLIIVLEYTLVITIFIWFVLAIIILVVISVIDFHIYHTYSLC